MIASVPPMMYLVVAFEMNHCHIIRIEADVVIIDIQLIQLDLVMNDAIVLFEDRFSAVLAIQEAIWLDLILNNNHAEFLPLFAFVEILESEHCYIILRRVILP